MKKLSKILVGIAALLLVLWVVIEIFAAKWVRDAVTKQLQHFPNDTIQIEQVNITYFPIGLEFVNTTFDLHLPLDSMLVRYEGKLGEARIKGVNFIEIWQGKSWAIELLEAEDATIDWVVTKTDSILKQTSTNKSDSTRRDILIKTLNFDNLNLSLKRNELELAFETSLELDSVFFARKKEVAWSVRAIKLQSKAGYFKELVNNYDLGYQAFSYNSADGELDLQNLYLKPTQSREAFIKNTKYISVQSDIKLARLRLSGIDHTRLNRGLYAKALILDSLHAELFEDTRKPRKPGRVPLPSESLLKLPFELQVDSLNIVEASLDYYEKAKTANEVAYLQIDNINGSVYPLSNVGYTLSTEMYLDAKARFMKGSNLTLNAHFLPESKNHRFTVEARLGKTDATIFNPVIKPIADIGIKSGVINNVYAAFSGDDYRASGFVKMDYDDLKVELPPKEKDEDKGFLTKLTQSIGNFAAVNNNHTFDRNPGEIKYEREPERPFINYWWVAMRGGIKDIVKVF